MKELWLLVGLDDLEGNIFAICSSKEKAEKAMNQLFEMGYESSIEIQKSYLKLDTIIIDNITITL